MQSRNGTPPLPTDLLIYEIFTAGSGSKGGPKGLSEARLPTHSRVKWAFGHRNEDFRKTSYAELSTIIGLRASVYPGPPSCRTGSPTHSRLIWPFVKGGAKVIAVHGLFGVSEAVAP